MRVTVERPLVHRCPYRDEIDIGSVKASWDGDKVELHEFAEYLDLLRDQKLTHEAATERIADFLGGVAENVEVVTTWQTAGMAVTVTA